MHIDQPLPPLHAEYVGNIPAEKREEVMQQLNRECQRLIGVRAVNCFSTVLIDLHVYAHICVGGNKCPSVQEW